jgi:putative ABC transport system permease protein
MSLWPRLREAIRAQVRRKAEEREMEEEMRFHLESETAARVRAGQDPGAARRAALHSFGAVDRYQEEVRDARGLRWLDDAIKDVRFGARSLARAPGVSAVAVVTLALGIGATTAIFSVVKGVLLEPLPFGEPDRLVSVWGRFLPESGFDFPVFVLSPPEYFDYRAENRTMEDVAVVSGTSVTIVPDGGAAQRVRAARVTANTFSVLGVAPVLGRGITAEEDAPVTGAVVVLSHALWQSAFGGVLDIVGRTLRVNGRGMEIVGVMPAGFSFPGDGVLLWAPIGLDPSIRTNRSSHYLRAIARLRPDATLAAASAEMETIMARWKAEYPEIHTGHFLWLQPLKEDVVGNVRTALLVLLGAVGVVMLIVCANVANLLLARGAARQTEIAVRATLGAGRRRLGQQLMTESAILAFAGAAFGLLLAWLGLRTILSSTNALPRTANIEIDALVLFFTIAVSLLATFVAGVAPAWRAGAVDPQASIREGARSVTAGKRASAFRSVLVVTEVALAVLLIAGAGLMIRSFRTLTGVHPGFNPEGALMADISLPAGDYDSARVYQSERELLDRMTRLPGVQVVGMTSSLPLFETPGNYDFDIENWPPAAPGQPATSGDFITASPGLLAALDISLARGRWFEESDREGALLVAAVNRTAARMFWPNEEPLGKRIRMSSSNSTLPWLTIVGVVDDVKYASLQSDFRPAWYAPLAQMAEVQGAPVRSVTYVLRTSDPSATASAVRTTIAEFDPDLPIGTMNTVDDVLRESLAGPRFILTLLTLFASLALLLGSIGLYGVLSYSVSERAHELGIRMALGERRSSLLARVAWRGIGLALAGVAIGIPAALLSSRIMTGLLFETSPTDARTFASVAVTMIVVAAVASLVPAVRAIRLDPRAVMSR